MDRTIQPAISPMKPFRIQRPDTCALSNGIPLHVFRAGSEEVVRLDILVRGGQWEQTQPLQATFTARMLREGTRSYDSGRIAEALDYYGAWLDVSSSMTHAILTLYALRKYFAPTLRLAASMLREPLFPEKELAVVVEGNRQQYLVNREKVEVMARRRLNEHLFGKGHPCGRYAVLDDYDRLTPDVLRAMHERYYGSANCTCYLSGRVTDEEVRLLDEMLGREPWGCVGAAPSPADRLPVTEAGRHCFVHRPDALQSAVRMGCFTVGCDHPDYFKTRLMVTLFGGYFGSRLMKNIREDKGYTYGISAGIVSYPFRNVLVVSTQTANDYAPLVVREVEHEMERLQTERVADAELDMVRNYTLGDMCRSYESPFSLSDAYIFLQTAGLEPDFFTRSQQAVLDITADDVRDLACKYLRKENFTEVIAGKKCAENPA